MAGSRPEFTLEKLFQIELHDEIDSLEKFKDNWSLSGERGRLLDEAIAKLNAIFNAAHDWE